MSFLDHTKELLVRLRNIVYSLIITTIIVMLVPLNLDFLNTSALNPYYPTIASYTIRSLQESFLPADVELIPLSFVAPLEVYIFISLIIGTMISSPIIAYELYKFVNPALHKNERKAIFQFTVSFTILFAFGFLLGYLFVVPVSIQTIFLFSNLLNLPPTYAFNEFFSFVGIGLLVCGLLLTLPTFLVVLVKAGILETKSFSGNRKYLYGLLIIGISILDPDPSIITETFVFLPLLVITEISILIAKRIERNRT